MVCLRVQTVPPKDMMDLICLLQFLTWLYVSDYRNFWNMKDVSLSMHSPASFFNCFTYSNLFQNGVGRACQRSKFSFVKSSIFRVLGIIRFYFRISPAYGKMHIIRSTEIVILVLSMLAYSIRETRKS